MGTPAKVRSLGTSGSPYGFAMGARRARRAAGVFGGEAVRLIAPAGDDPALARWVEVPSGVLADVWPAEVSPKRGGSKSVRIATYGEELIRLVLHPEYKMLGLDGDVCKARTKGPLTPRRALVRAIHSIGKEGNRLEEIATGEVTDPDEVLMDYATDEWEAVVLPVLRAATTTEVARLAGMDRAGLSDYLRARSPRRPTKATQAKLNEVATALVEKGVVRTCTFPGCSAWARPTPSQTCSNLHSKGRV